MLTLKIYRAFSQVVADLQFAAPGLVLLATLARVDALVVLSKEDRAIGEQREAANVAVERLLHAPGGESEDFGSHVARESLDTTLDELPVESLESHALPESLLGGGKATEEVSEDLEVMFSSGEVKLGALPEAAPMKREKKRKRKRPRDEIDDLFAGLL